MSQNKNIFSRIISTAVFIINFVAALGMIVSAYSGHISAQQWRFAPLAVMSFALWYIAIFALLVIDLLWWRRSAIVAGAAIVICLPQILGFSPVHLPKGEMDAVQKQRSFTLMAYNVMLFDNLDKDTPWQTNQQIDYILAESPDIVCIEEARCFSPHGTHITQEQLQDINNDYRYIYIEGEDLGLLSKFDTRPVHIDFNSEDDNGHVGLWRMKIHGEIVNVFVVHLRSFRFSIEEKGLFYEATNVESTNRKYIREAKTDLLPKAIQASKMREDQIEQLIRNIEKYGGKNTIVCGDFNDPVGSYGLNRLKEACGLKSVYAEVGFGPMITYNAYNFMFRIDHILYRGDITPWSMTKGKIGASDHYPIMATFLLENVAEKQ